MAQLGLMAKFTVIPKLPHTLPHLSPFTFSFLLFCLWWGTRRDHLLSSDTFYSSEGQKVAWSKAYCISQLSVTVTKYLRQSTYKEERLI
jgi:hypothetical protein